MARKNPPAVGAVDVWVPATVARIVWFGSPSLTSVAAAPTVPTVDSRHSPTDTAVAVAC